GYITPASNDFCFSATPSGYKNLSNNTYTTRGFFAYWWTSTSNKDEVLSKSISYDNAAVIEKAFVGEGALSVRCIKK
ncbi:MAG TPA: FISUMP domain-containing protein, partial [Chitinophagales bacterium]|nr:FISUMP domain-containing protein [Chitinophagales bacterium]